jgi:predicted dehydrogenase
MIRAIVIGLGNMGQSHALALHAAKGVEIVALVNRSSRDLPAELQGYPVLDSIDDALLLAPDLVPRVTRFDRVWIF